MHTGNIRLQIHIERVERVEDSCRQWFSRAGDIQLWCPWDAEKIWNLMEVQIFYCGSYAWLGTFNQKVL